MCEEEWLVFVPARVACVRPPPPVCVWYPSLAFVPCLCMRPPLAPFSPPSSSPTPCVAPFSFLIIASQQCTCV